MTRLTSLQTKQLCFWGATGAFFITARLSRMCRQLIFGHISQTAFQHKREGQTIFRLEHPLKVGKTKALPVGFHADIRFHHGRPHNIFQAPVLQNIAQTADRAAVFRFQHFAEWDGINGIFHDKAPFHQTAHTGRVNSPRHRWLFMDSISHLCKRCYNKIQRL